jgi:hypothetical protein
MVNLDDPKEFFRVIVDPNLQEFYANEGDLRLGVNSIVTLDALVAYYTKKTAGKAEPVQKAKCAGKTKSFERHLRADRTHIGSSGIQQRL